MRTRIITRRIICALMALIIVLSCNVFAASAPSNIDETVLLNAAQGIIDAEAKYYNIENATVVNPSITQKENGGYYVEYILELTMQLKCGAATELPQIRGLADGFNIDSAALTTQEFVDKMNSADVLNATAKAATIKAAELAHSLSNAELSTLSAAFSDSVELVAENDFAIATQKNLMADNDAAQTVNKELIVAAAIADIAIADTVNFVQEVEAESIGVSNQFNFALRAEFDSDDNYVGIEYGLVDGYTHDISAVIPSTENEMFALGKNQAINTVEAAAQAVPKALEVATSASRANTSFTYKKISARDYANTYTSNPTSHTCTGSYNGHQSAYESVKQNKSYYNNSYRHYCGVDCANFASQVMAAGGVPTSTTWKPYTSAWVGGTSMKNYFYGNSLWTKTNFANAAAGEIMQMISSSGTATHTMVIVLNDTVNRKYSAHTTDRKEVTYTQSTFTSCDHVEYYRFDNYSLA